MPVFGIAVFSSAFLLFLVQPMIAKAILPGFGGAAAVWVTCLVFFQVALCAGYLYAHLLVARLPDRAGRWVHLALLSLSLAFLPIAPGVGEAASAAGGPALAILLLLAGSLGLPYLLLSASTPLLQSWYLSARGKSPYRLFALSNAGSLAGLLCYPLLVEPLLPVRRQLLLWSALYAAAAFLTAALAWRARGVPAAAVPAGPGGAPDSTPAVPEEAPPSRAARLLWMAFPACSTALLYGVTAHLTQNVASVPFLWVPPLALYLGSFILCFARRSRYWRSFWLRALGVALAALAYALGREFADSSLRLLAPLFWGGLFVCCMVCHGELARLKPPPRRLTSYYLAISVGGALGGLYAGVLAPLVYEGYGELPAALAACAVLVLLALRHDPGSRLLRGGSRRASLGLVALVLLLVAALQYRTGPRAGTRLRVRNFYGSLSVVEATWPPEEPSADDSTRDLPPPLRFRKLMHGSVVHGVQYLEEELRREATAYYVPSSGVALAVREAAARGPIRLGVVGLGTGTLAAYGRPGDAIRFYEINPLVTELARREFTYLADSAAAVEVVPGDARLSLEREPPQGYDVLAVDAFAGDAIPVHLLTREAFGLYLRHLKPGGVLAAHLSNRHLDLPPVAGRIAEALGYRAVLVESEAGDPAGVFRAQWVLLSGREAFFEDPQVAQVARPVPRRPGSPLWTDDASSLLRLWQ